MLLPVKLAGGSSLRISLCVRNLGSWVEVAGCWLQTHAPARQAGRGQLVSSICVSGIGGIAYIKGVCDWLQQHTCLAGGHTRGDFTGTHTWSHGDTHVEATVCPRGGWSGIEHSVLPLFGRSEVCLLVSCICEIHGDTTSRLLYVPVVAGPELNAASLPACLAGAKFVC